MSNKSIDLPKFTLRHGTEPESEILTPDNKVLPRFIGYIWTIRRHPDKCEHILTVTYPAGGSVSGSNDFIIYEGVKYETIFNKDFDESGQFLEFIMPVDVVNYKKTIDPLLEKEQFKVIKKTALQQLIETINEYPDNAKDTQWLLNIIDDLYHEEIENIKFAYAHGLLDGKQDYEREALTDEEMDAMDDYFEKEFPDNP